MPPMGTPAITAFVDEGLGNSSYVVETGDGRALIIDPPRDASAHLQLAESRRLRPAWSVETHLHADFVSGSRELAALGATVVAPRAGGLEFPHRGLTDGDELDLGGLRLRGIGTPGHTPEHLSYLLLDDERPIALFSGGALLPGAVARTDLIAPEQTEGLARALYRSLHGQLLTLPDDLSVYPTHGAGSFCSSAADGERVTTIGRERAANPLLAAPDEDTFVARLLGGLGSYPPYFLRLREVNRRGPRVYGPIPRLPSLTVAELAAHLATGGELVDVRPIRAFAAGHLPGSLSIALRPAFASWLGWLVTPERPVAFVLDAAQDRRELVRQALGIGYELLAGELAGGVDAWHAAGRALVHTELVSDIDPRVTALVDVRQESEWQARHVPGALHRELGRIGAEPQAIPPDATMMCGHGERAMSAASLVERAGGDPAVFLGGPGDWARRSGEALVRGR